MLWYVVYSVLVILTFLWVLWPDKRVREVSASNKEFLQSQRRQLRQERILSLEHTEGIVALGHHLDSDNCHTCKTIRQGWLQEACEHPREHEGKIEVERDARGFPTGVYRWACGICGHKRVDDSAKVAREERERKRQSLHPYVKLIPGVTKGFEWHD